MRSAPVSSAAWTIASPIERARTARPSTLTPRSSPSSAASASDAAARSSSPTSSASSASSSGTRSTCTATTAAPRSCASLTAVATISSPISPSFTGTRIFENSACGSSPSAAGSPGWCALASGAGPAVPEEPRPAATAHEEVDDDTDGEPDRAAVPGADVRDHRRDEDRGGRQRAEDRRERHVRAADADRERHTEGTLEAGLGEPKPHDRELRGGEREEDAEAEQACQEADGVGREVGRDE